MSGQRTQRTRFGYLVGDKVTVTLTGGGQRHGTIEVQVKDPDKKPYLVRYDPTLADPEPCPANGFFDEHQLSRDLSPPFVAHQDGACERGCWPRWESVSEAAVLWDCAWLAGRRGPVPLTCGPYMSRAVHRPVRGGAAVWLLLTSPGDDGMAIPLE